MSEHRYRLINSDRIRRGFDPSSGPVDPPRPVAAASAVMTSRADLVGARDDDPIVVKPRRSGFAPACLGGSQRAAGVMGQLAGMHVRAGHAGDAYMIARWAAREALAFLATRDRGRHAKGLGPFELNNVDEYATRVVTDYAKSDRGDE